MNIKPIKTEQDYQVALKAVEPLFEREAELSETELDFLDVTITLIEAYESKHYAITPPDPIEAIKFRMEQQGLTVKDMAETIGKPNRVYEVFNRKRPLTLTMIRNLHQKLGIGGDVLLG